ASAGDPCPGTARWAGDATWPPGTRRRSPSPGTGAGNRSGSSALFLHHFDVLAAGRFEQLAGFGFRIFRVAGFDHDEKPVMGRLREPAMFQEWMMESGQPIQKEHAEQGPERAEQNRQLIRRREGAERAE